MNGDVYIPRQCHVHVAGDVCNVISAVSGPKCGLWQAGINISHPTTTEFVVYLLFDHPLTTERAV